MPDETKGPEINNTGPSLEAPKQPGAPTSPEQVRTDQVVEAAREAVAADKPQPVLEDVANGGNGAIRPEQGALVTFDTGSVQGAMKSFGRGISESRDAKVDDYRDRIDAVNRGEELQPGDKGNIRGLMSDYLRLGGTRPETIPDQTASSGAPPEKPPLVAVGAGSEGENNDESSNGQPPEIPPPPIVGTEGDGVNDEMARLHGNIEAVAQKKESGEPAMSTDETPKPIIVRQALIDNANRVGEGKGWDALAEGSNPQEVKAVINQLKPELSDTEIDGMTQEEVFSLITDATNEGKIVVGEPESAPIATEPTEPDATPQETPLEQVDNPDDDVDFSAPNPVGGPALEPEQAAAPTPEPEPELAATEPQPAEPEPRPAQTETPEERLRRIYESMTPEGRHKRAEAIRKEISRMETRMDKVASLDDMEEMQKRIEAAQNHLDLIEETQQDKDDPKFVGKNKGEIDTSGDEAARKLDETIDEYRRFGESSFDELKKTETKEQFALKGLREQMSRATTKEGRNLIAGRIADTEARLAVIKNFKTEKETGHIEEKNAEALQETELRRRELGKPGELEASITGSKAKLEKLDNDILGIEEKIIKEKDGSSEWKRLNNEKLELSKRANKIRETLRLDEDALKAAEEKRRQESGTGDTPTLENIERKSVGEYLSLSPQERKNYLRSVSEALPNDGRYNFAEINGRAAGGEALTIEEKAYLSNEITRRLLTKSGYEASCLPLLAAQHPEVFGLVSDKIMASKAAEAFRRENFATGWEKMLDFAKKNPQLLALLMLLIVGAVAGPTTTVIGAGKFMMR
jgi:hypothetical protein